MTVETQARTTSDFVSTGVTEFAITYPFFDPADILVEHNIDGEHSELVLDADYTVEVNDAFDGGRLILLTEFSSGKIETQRRVVALQSINTTETRTLRALATERQLDRMVMAEIDATGRQDALLSRAVMVRRGLASQILPYPDDGKIIGWVGGTLSNLQVLEQGELLASDVGKALLTGLGAGFTFASQSQFEAAAIPAALMYVELAGYYFAGDEGRHRKKRVPAPAIPKAWHSRSADGAWWLLIVDVVTPLHFGAVAVSGTDSTAAFAAMVGYAATFGTRMKLPGGGRVYEKAGRTLIHDNFDLEIAAGATLRRTGSDGYLFTNTDGTRSGGYDGCKGFRLRGDNRINSIIDLNSAGPTTTSAMVFAHQDGWLVSNVCIKGGYQSHYAEINSSRGVRFINCSFPDHAFTAGASNFETLQLDYSNAVGYPENGPYDNTPCTDVQIIGCYFGPGQSAIGTHSTPAADLHSNIHVIGCTFDAQAAYTIRMQGWINSEVVGNIIRNAGVRGILCYDCKHVAIQRNWIIGGCANDGSTTGYAVAIGTKGGVDPLAVSVKNNRIVGVLAVGIYAASGTRHDISDNYLEDAGEEAISIGSAVTQHILSANRVFGASVSVAGAKVAIRVAGSSGKIHANVVKRSDAVNTYGYGIYFPSGALRNTCSNNDVQAGVNGGIGDQSPATSLTALNGRVLLFSGSATSGTVVLADDITSFAALEVQTGVVGTGTFSSGRATPISAVSGWVVGTDHVTVRTISGKVDCTITSITQLTIATANDAVRAIYGLAA